VRITFRCVPKLAEVLPRPVPALEGLPEWLKVMPSTVHSALKDGDIDTVKRCPPFVDAMSYGYLMPLVADLTFRSGRLSWDREALGGKSPVDFHENIQVKGSPLYDSDRSVLKFNNYWTIEVPSGYAVLITHPFNRLDLPFTTITGLVDSDRYYENFINFPARWRDATFEGVLPKGTPIAQCIPIRRDVWEENFEVMDMKAGEKLIELSNAIDAEPGVYRKQFRAR
jgi:hypothetical protein